MRAHTISKLRILRHNETINVNSLTLRLAGPLVFLLPLSLYLMLPASTINGDGLGYYYLVLGGDWKAKFLPGHLLYCPLMTVLGRIAEATHLTGVREAMLLSDQLAGAASAYLLFRIAQHLGLNQFGQWLAALGLAFSFGVWKEATDIKTYAPALLFVIASVGQMIRYAEGSHPRQLVVLGALNSVAALFHLAAIFLVVTSVCFIVVMNRGASRRMLKSVAAYAGSVAVFFALPIFIIGFWVLKLSTVGEILAWLKSAEHGYRVVLDVLSIPRAVYGFARTFVYLEFFWAAPKWIIALKSLGLAAAGVWTTWGIRSMWDQLSPTAKAVLGSLSAFVLLQAVFGVYFFGSDTERWIFIAPVVWLALAGHLSHLAFQRRRIAAVAVCFMFTINLIQAIGPAATDAATKTHVLALNRWLPAQALLITPGQDWTGYYYYYTSKRLETVGLLGLAMQHRDDTRGFYRELEARIADARKAKRTIVMIRVLDPSEDYNRTPWQELADLGYLPDRLRRWFQQYRWKEQRLIDPERTRIYWLR